LQPLGQQNMKTTSQNWPDGLEKVAGHIRSSYLSF